MRRLHCALPGANLLNEWLAEQASNRDHTQCAIKDSLYHFAQPYANASLKQLSDEQGPVQT
eukprot:5924535-Karenia_brevis.AAC.1